MFNPLKYFTNRKVGLALGSGGAKGIAHIAVIEYLAELKIPIHFVSGSSVGALVGALYCEGRLEKLKDDLLSMESKNFLELFEPMIPVNGLIGTNSIMRFLGNYISPSRKIEDYPIPLRIVATDFSTGKAVIFDSGNVLEAIRASISIPGVFQPVNYEDTFLIDGGVANPLPVDVVREMGAGKVIAVNLHPAVKSKSKTEKKASVQLFPKISAPVPPKQKKDLPEPVQFLLDRVKSATELGKNAYLKYLADRAKEKAGKKNPPNIFETIFQSIDIMGYSNTVLMLRYDPPEVLIEPNLLEFGSLEFNRGREALLEGRVACEKVREVLIKKVKNFI